MEVIQIGLPFLLGLIAVFIALFTRRQQGEPIDLEGILEDGEEFLSAGAEFVQDLSPAAITIVQGLRQRYKNGELELEDLKPLAMQHLRTLFPYVDDDLLGIVVEGAVFGTKLIAKELWYRTQEDVGHDIGSESSGYSAIPL